MEPRRKRRPPHDGGADLQRKGDNAESLTIGSLFDRVQDSGLAQWKQERLAHHHAYFALLDRTFVRWKDVTLVRRQRRQRVIAACRVGARFFQRLYWTQWREYRTRRREARAEAAQRMSVLHNQVRLQICWRDWREDVKVGRWQRVNEQKKTALADRLAGERRLEVRGVKIQSRDPTAVGVIVALSAQPDTTSEGDQHSRRVEKLRRIVVYHSQRQYFQVWRSTARALEKLITHELFSRADGLHLRSAVRRWRRGLVARSEYETASRHAVFFLYYHLTKSSLNKLQRFAKTRRHELGVCVTVANCVRRRRLEAAFSMWRQRLNAKLVFTEWRQLVQGSRSSPPSPQLQVVGELVKYLSESRFLRQSFGVWLQQASRRRQSRVISRVLQGPMHKAALSRAFWLWRHQVDQQRRLQNIVERRNRDELMRVWQAWTDFAGEKELQARQRRTATRFWYYRTLRKAFFAFQDYRRSQREAEKAAERMIQAIERRRTGVLLLTWYEWSQRRLRRRENGALIQSKREQAMMQRAFGALRLDLECVKGHDRIAQHHKTEKVRKNLRQAFIRWRILYESQRPRVQFLDAQLESYLLIRATTVKRQAFQALAEYAKSKLTRRLLNSHARGHFQGKLMLRVFSQWVGSVDQCKWSHILNHRADQFRRRKMKERVYELWKARAQAIRNHRAKNRLALHHWKKVREREAFTAWRKYVTAKQTQRARMHAALELRHRAHIRDALSHWIAGAAQLAQQRSRKTVQMQATHTERVWRRVRDIALHWRWITQQRKHLLECNDPTGKARGVLNAFGYEGAYDVRPSPLRRGLALPLHDQRQHDRRGFDQQTSELSEFVMQPRKRPRPRKPIDLILDSAISDAPIHDAGIQRQESTNEDAADVLQAVNLRYGFHFPTASHTIVDLGHGQGVSPADHATVVDARATAAQESTRVTTKGADLNGRSIDELEQRLLYWQSWRQRLKQLQQSLENFRALLHQASLEGTLQEHDIDPMRSRLRAMEVQEIASRRRWEESRPEILALAHRIKLLRRGGAFPG